MTRHVAYTQYHIQKNNRDLIYSITFLTGMIVNCYFLASFFSFSIECNECCISANLELTCSQYEG